MGTATIEDLPDPIIEYIFSYLSPYRDLKQCMLVNRTWYYHVLEVVDKTQRDLKKAITSMSVHWYQLVSEPGPTISKRYSHSACCCGESMYVFGGCTTENTTFNDLWRLDLGTRCWVRPLATGTYPPPKACATLVSYEENLILFGGWTHSSPAPVQPAWRIFNHLHIYDTNSNRWSEVSIETGSPSLAGHSATMHGDMMVVFGGIQKQVDGTVADGEHTTYSNSNAVWALDLNTLTWRRCITTYVMPLPRYGHSQIAIDDHHLMIMGGCGGPNMLFNDIWLLEIKDDPHEPWVWKALDIREKENAAPNLAFHPACKVGNQLAIMSRRRRSQMSPASLLHPLRGPPRAAILEPARPDEGIDARLPSNQRVDVEHCVNGKKGVLKRQFERHHPNSSHRTSSSDEDDLHSPDFAKKLASSSGKYRSPPRTDATVNQAGPSRAMTNSSFDERSSVLPFPLISGSYIPLVKALTFPPVDHVPCVSDAASKTVGNEQENIRTLCTIRPCSRRNRQRQLEGLDRMEQRLRDLRAGALRFAGGARPKVSSLAVASKNPMCLYVLDISTAVSDGFVTWQKLMNQSDYAPEGIVLYSFLLGRGELIMFGGIRKNLNCGVQDGENPPEVVSNSLHFMSPRKYII